MNVDSAEATVTMDVSRDSGFESTDDHTWVPMVGVVVVNAALAGIFGSVSLVVSALLARAVTDGRPGVAVIAVVIVTTAAGSVLGTWATRSGLSRLRRGRGAQG